MISKINIGSKILLNNKIFNVIELGKYTFLAIYYGVTIQEMIEFNYDLSVSKSKYKYDSNGILVTEKLGHEIRINNLKSLFSNTVSSYFDFDVYLSYEDAVVIYSILVRSVPEVKSDTVLSDIIKELDWE
jgi:hypothetical protein